MRKWLLALAFGAAVLPGVARADEMPRCTETRATDCHPGQPIVITFGGSLDTVADYCDFTKTIAISDRAQVAWCIYARRPIATKN
jgi:hypothetical protein